MGLKPAKGRGPFKQSQSTGPLFSILSLLSILFTSCRPAAAVSPEAAAQAYVQAAWARDFAAVYRLLSADDQARQSEADYVAQNDPFEGGTLELARHLAGHIEFSRVHEEIQGNEATVTMGLRVPDGNDSDVSQILAVEGQSGPLSAERVRELTNQLDRLWATGAIDTVEGDQTIHLKRQAGRWGIYLDLAEAVRVTFSGGVQAGLPWEFEPLTGEVLLLPDESARVTYRARNLAAHEVTGKARESTAPAEYANSLYFAQCFCLLQETLQPGQEARLTAVIRLDGTLPAGAALQVRYDFYPIEAFPPGGN